MDDFFAFRFEDANDVHSALCAAFLIVGYLYLRDLERVCVCRHYPDRLNVIVIEMTVRA